VDALLFRVIYCWGTIGARKTMDFDMISYRPLYVQHDKPIMQLVFL
jgi:hypothetical protein